MPPTPRRLISPAMLGDCPSGTAEGAPYSPLYDDIYHAKAGAWAQARHVFLGGNGLPGRWQGRQRFTILETGFGLGNNFLATWAAWRADPSRCRRLVFISIEKHPLTGADLRRQHVHSTAPDPANTGPARADTQSNPAPALARRLCDAWPPLMAGTHVLDFDEPDLPPPPGPVPGAPYGVTLLLVLGDVAQALPQLLALADAIYLDGFAPAKNPDMWSAHLLSRLNRWAAPGATVATWSAARSVRDALAAAGFEVRKEAGFGHKRDMTVARFTPRHTPPLLPGGLWPEPSHEHHAVVVGAGLAGCAAAWALTQDGWRVTLLERHPQAAQEASGNPGGLFHATVHSSDGPHARLLRAAALLTAQQAGPWIAQGRLAGQCQGLLRLDARTDDEGALALLAELGLPPEHVRWLPQAEASQRCGLSLPSGGWWFEQAGWLHPAGYAQLMLEQARLTGLLTEVYGQDALALQRVGNTPANSAPGAPMWQVLGASHAVLASAPCVVLANAHNATALASTAGQTARLEMGAVRGQISWLAADTPGLHPPRHPVASGGYALTLADGSLLCGATQQANDPDPHPRQSDHRHNLAQAHKLGALAAACQHTSPPAGPADTWAQGAPFVDAVKGRVGWRATTPDRLPLIGALPQDPAAVAAQLRPEQVRKVPRLRDAHGGVFVFSGLGSRGICWAALGSRVLSHWITGSACPVESGLRDALDPARFVVREQRQQQRLRSAPELHTPPHTNHPPAPAPTDD